MNMSSEKARAGRMLRTCESCLVVCRPLGKVECDILGKIHVHGGGHDAVVPGVGPVTPVVGGATADVVDHAAEQVDGPPSLGRGRALGLGVGMVAGSGRRSGGHVGLVDVWYRRHGGGVCCGCCWWPGDLVPYQRTKPDRCQGIKGPVGNSLITCATRDGEGSGCQRDLVPHPRMMERTYVVGVVVAIGAAVTNETFSVAGRRPGGKVCGGFPASRAGLV